MNRLAFAIAFVVITCNLNGCAVYTTPYDNVGISYGYAPYGGYGYYNHYGFGPRFYGGWGGGYGWGGHRWGGRGWRGRGWH